MTGDVSEVVEAAEYVKRAGDRLAPRIVFRCRKHGKVAAAVYDTPAGLLWAPRHGFRATAALSAAVNREWPGGDETDAHITTPSVLVAKADPGRVLDFGCKCATSSQTAAQIVELAQAITRQTRAPHTVLFP